MKRGKSQDRRLVAGGQEHETRYVSKKKGVTEERVKSAIKRVGNSREEVERALRGKK